MSADAAVTVLWFACVLLLLLLMLAWRLSRLATRLDRAHARAERTWSALDEALVVRARRAAELAAGPEVDPATALLVLDAAARSLAERLSISEREEAESEVSQVLSLVALPGLDREHRRVTLARRLHNDAVVACCALRNHSAVRIFRLAGHAVAPTAFEIADGNPTSPPPTGAAAGADAMPQAKAVERQGLQLVWRQS